MFTVHSPTFPCDTVMRCVVEIVTCGSVMARVPLKVKSGSLMRWRPGSKTMGCPFWSPSPYCPGSTRMMFREPSGEEEERKSDDTTEVCRQLG